MFDHRDETRDGIEPKILGDLEVWPVNAPEQMTWDEATAWCASLGEKGDEA